MLPDRIVKLVRKAQAFCVPKKSVIYVSLAFLGVEGYLGILNFVYPSDWFVSSMITTMVVLGTLTLLTIFLGAFRIVVIRRQCNECQFNFHLIAHETTHLELNSRDEDLVERETLKQTGDRLFPILLSKPKLCKDCALKRRIYAETAAKWAENNQKSNY